MKKQKKRQKKSLYQFQREALDKIKDRDNAALFWQMGAGKTISSIELTEYWSSPILVCLVLKSTVNQWLEELYNQTERTVFNGYKKENPNAKDIINGWWTEQVRKIRDIDFKIFGANLTWNLS